MSDNSTRRMMALNACKERFEGKEPAYGKRDCLIMVRHALHKVGRRVGKAPAYSTELGGLRALKRLGHASLLEAVDARGLVRIAPAAALPADIIALAADDAFGCALTLSHGNGKLLGFTEGQCRVFIPSADPAAYLAAWRLI